MRDVAGRQLKIGSKGGCREAILVQIDEIMNAENHNEIKIHCAISFGKHLIDTANAVKA